MAEKRGGLSVVPGLRTILEVQLEGAWYEVDGVGSMSYTAGARGEAQVQAFQGSRALLGDIPATSVSFPIIAYLPNDWVWGEIYAGYLVNSNFRWQVTTPEDKLFPSGDTAVSPAGVTVAIEADNGEVTPAGAGADFGGADIQRNAVIRIAGANYTIRSIDVDAAGVATASVFPHPDMDVAGVYSVVLPSIRVGPFSARVRSTNSMEIGSDEGSVLASSLEILPPGTLPRGVIHTP